MYCDYFGFKERPFTIAPNPKYLFMSERHREALAHLLFGVGDSGGFVLLTGEVGTGKTTVCRCLLEQLPEHTDIAFILNPKLSAIELLQTICDDLDLEYGIENQAVSIKQLNDVLNQHLLKSYAAGRHTILLIDEAQNLSSEVLEQIRLLTNLETNEKKLLQIILIGQPELKTILSKTELRQLSQRITARYHLDPLTLEETSGYIHYRMAVAGSEASLFPPKSIETIHKISQGVPRLINTICDRCLLGAYSRNLKKVDTSLVKQAAIEVLGEKGRATTATPLKKDNSRGSNFLIKTITVVVLLMIGVLAGLWLPTFIQQPKPSLPQPISNTLAIVANIEPEKSKQQPSLTTMSTDYVEAISNLAMRWGLVVPGDCNLWSSSGFICSQQKGNWGEFLSFNRPAILTVTINGERTFISVLSADGEQATITKQNKIISVPLSEIQPLWNGEYTLLWKSPFADLKVIQLGDSGVPVQWLEKQLLSLENPNSTDEIIIPDTMRFDTALKKQLIQFQTKHGLRADGVAGQQTIMMINQLRDSSIPLLTDDIDMTLVKNAGEK
jgi:general secretion pathway protein A